MISRIVRSQMDMQILYSYCFFVMTPPGRMMAIRTDQNGRINVGEFLSQISAQFGVPECTIGLCDESGKFLDYGKTFTEQNIVSGRFLFLIPIHFMVHHLLS